MVLFPSDEQLFFGEN